jgi:hypothetical protein
VRILTVVQGRYGERITANLQAARVPGWTVECWAAPRVLPPVIDYPEDYLPDELPSADLVLSLGEHPGVAELLPDIVTLCGAQAVIAPVDNVAWLPPGLMRQLDGWLAAMGVAAVFPKPFCSLTETTLHAYRKEEPYVNGLVAEFARHFGRPALMLTLDESGAAVAEARVERDSPCGCARHVAEALVGVSVEEAEERAGMSHHHYPCLAAMAMDPEYNDTLMHVSGHILIDEVARNVRPFKEPVRYLRPQGRSD